MVYLSLNKLSSSYHSNFNFKIIVSEAAVKTPRGSSNIVFLLDSQSAITKCSNNAITDNNLVSDCRARL